VEELSSITQNLGFFKIVIVGIKRVGSTIESLKVQQKDEYIRQSRWTAEDIQTYTVSFPI
jgi:hypothetical protein